MRKIEREAISFRRNKGGRERRKSLRERERDEEEKKE